MQGGADLALAVALLACMLAARLVLAAIGPMTAGTIIQNSVRANPRDWHLRRNLAQRRSESPRARAARIAEYEKDGGAMAR